MDTRPSIASPSASSPKSSGENHPANLKRNAIASEVQVIATGARSSEKGGQRELFTEETTTALVFENGGVLRLAAAVIPGQLLFLTHKESKKEVVAQVTRKRDFRPMICYVEVEFSEPAPGFWGIEFPKTPAPLPANAQQKEAAGFAQAEEDIIGGEPAEPTSAPSAEEVSALKDEVEVLREQLKLLQTQIVGGNSPAPTVNPDLPRTTAPEPPRAAAGVATQAPVLADAPGEQLLKLLAAAGEVSQESSKEDSSVLASVHAAPPGASTSLPIQPAEPSFSAQDLLPKAAPHFQDAKPPAKLAPKVQQNIAAGSRSAAMRKDILFAAFVLIVAGAAWYQNLLPGLPVPKNVFSSNAQSSALHAVSQMPQKTASAQPDSGKSLQAKEVPTTPPTAALHAAPQSAASGAGNPSALAEPDTGDEAKSASESTADVAPVEEKQEVAAIAAKRSAPSLSKAALVSVTPPSEEAGIVPPKLIKSVRAIASPNALPEFATSNSDNVTFDALVDTSGHVTSMKALSGSPSLQSAAMAALKQYRYEPATNHGKPVPAHVTVTIKFLFEP
ncbi:MAG TPA: energy transducer TonB [Candidatus Acidoferrum sp.]|nr:energy transducer TonB [Candidatus Acidoferrum sp.]